MKNLITCLTHILVCVGSMVCFVFVGQIQASDLKGLLHENSWNWDFLMVPISPLLETLIIADLTNDSRLDIALTSAAGFTAGDTESLYLLPQTPEGNLGTALVHPAGLRPVAMASGDLNGSGRNDLVVIFGGENTLNIYAQTESGTLAAPMQYVTDAEPQSVVVGDFNTDGRDDVLVAHAEAQCMSLYLQMDSGILSVPITYTVESAGFVQLAVGDLDGDGTDDVALLRGSGFAAGQVVFFTQQNGTLAGPFTRTVTTGDLGAHAIAVGDVTGDGRDDIVVVAGGFAPEAYLNVLAQSPAGEIAVTPVAYATPGLPEAVAIGDIDHDGYNDVVVAHATQETLSIYLQDGLGAFLPYESTPLPYSDHYNPHGLALGDLNGDGGLDIALADYSNGLVLLYNEVSAPLASIDTPNRFAYVTEHGAYTFFGSVSDAEHVQISLDGGQNWTDTTVESGTWTNTSTLSSDDVYRIKVRAVDVTGKVQSPPALARLVIDTIAPTSQVNDLAEYQTATTFPIGWSGNDNVAGIAYYDIQVRVGTGGSWTDWLTQTTTTTATFPGEDGHTYAFRSRAVDQAGNVEDWPATPDAQTTVDTLSPVSSVDLLAAYQTDTAFIVRWQGIDTVSGIASYDIQVREGIDGIWSNWLTNTVTTSVTFTGQINQTYCFRSSAVDVAGNQEEYAEGNGDTCTTITEYGLQVAPQSLSIYANPGQMVTFTHYMTNTSLVSDTFACEVTSLLGWIPSQTFSITLGAEQATSIHFTVTVPSEVLAYMVERIYLTMISSSNTEVTQGITDTLTVNQVRGISVSAGQIHLAEPGDIVTYTHTLTNTGNYSDTYTIAIVSEWSQLLTPDRITIKPWSAQEIVLRVEVPIALEDSLDHLITSTVTSMVDTTVGAMITDTIYVNVANPPRKMVYLPLVLRNR